MAHLDHLYALRKEHTRRLKGLELQQASYGISVDPSITNEIEDIRSELADNERQITQEWLGLSKRYEHGFGDFLGRLTPRDPHRDDALIIQERLNEFIKFVREGGDSEVRVAEHHQMMQQVNDLAIKTLGTSFYEFCGITPGASASDLPPPAQPLPQPSRLSTPNPGAAGIGIGSITGLNIIFDSQIIGQQSNSKSSNDNDGAGKRRQRPPQPPTLSSMDQQILALAQAVKECAAPTLIPEARTQVLDLQRAFGAVDVRKMAMALTWFEQNILTLSNLVRALICDRGVIDRVNAAGAEAVLEFQHRFGQCDDCQER